jgi:hypothetical protein
MRLATSNTANAAQRDGARHIEWINRFLSELGRLPEITTVADAMIWALKAYAADPKRRPDLAARAFARGVRTNREKDR